MNDFLSQIRLAIASDESSSRRFEQLLTIHQSIWSQRANRIELDHKLEAYFQVFFEFGIILKGYKKIENEPSVQVFIPKLVDWLSLFMKSSSVEYEKIPEFQQLHLEYKEMYNVLWSKPEYAELFNGEHY